MPRCGVEVADILRDLEPVLRPQLSRIQHKAMNAILACRTAKLGGHITRCEDCGTLEAAYNSCRNRHCPKCQAAASFDWLEARKQDVLPVAYDHVVFTLPDKIAQIARQNRKHVYTSLFKAVSQTLMMIGADPKHLGAKLGATLVLHTWGSAMTHHPHIHGIVPAGGISPDGTSWKDCRKNFFLPVRVLSRLFRRLMCEQIAALYTSDKLEFHGELAKLNNADEFAAYLKSQRQRDWVVYAKRPFAGPEQVLSYLARYTHRIAISNKRITAYDGHNVTFKVKDYRKDGQAHYGQMQLGAKEFARRFLQHVLPDGLHRIRHVGFLANTVRRKNIQIARKALSDRISPDIPLSKSDTEIAEDVSKPAPKPCPDCGGRLILIDLVMPASRQRKRALPEGINSS